MPKIKLSTILRLVAAVPVIVSAGKTAYKAVRDVVAKPPVEERKPFTMPYTREEMRVIGTPEDPRLARTPSASKA